MMGENGCVSCILIRSSRGTDEGTSARKEGSHGGIRERCKAAKGVRSSSCRRRAANGITAAFFLAPRLRCRSRGDE